MTSPTRFHLYLMGTFRLERDGIPLPLPTHKTESLLAYLALHRGPYAREKLAALFWGDSTDAQARHSLNVALNRLRTTVSQDLLLTDRATVELNPDLNLWVDALAFRDAAQRAAQGQPLASLDHPPFAAAPYADLLTNFYDDWILSERETYRALYVNTLLTLSQQCAADSDYARAIEYAQQVLPLDPANERAHQQLMFCYIAQGERQNALEQYTRCVNALREEVGIDEPSPETIALYEWIRQTTTTSNRVHLTNLPLPLTSFIGRVTELHDLKQRLSRSRLVTLTGAGGSGKTRFAIQAGIQALEAFRNGVWWIDLAPLTDPARLTETVNRALGIQFGMHQDPTETLLETLRAEQRLLIFDNCEHLLDASAQLIQTLLQTGSELKILATSREPLNLTGEVVYIVPTLSVPATTASPLPTTLLDYEAIRLFVERAQAVDAHFTLNTANAAAVMQICTRLDGIPLAIELAAARTHALSASEIAARLDDRFALLTRGARTALPRQQTLHAMMDWSYNLLTDRERLLFEQLSIFAGGFTLRAAEYVCEPEKQVLDILTRLVEKSLVVRQTYGELTRYSMLETVREYASEKLHEFPLNYARAARRHLDYFYLLGRQFHREMRRAMPWHLYDIFMPEIENMQVGLHRAFEGETIHGYTKARQLSRGMMMINMLWLMWFHRGANVGATHALARFLELDEVPASMRVRVLMLSTLIARSRADWGRARAFAQEMCERALQSNDRLAYARALDQLALAERDHLNIPASLVYMEQARAVFAESGAILDVNRSTMFMGENNLLLGNLDLAQEQFEQALVWFRQIDDKGHIAWGIEWQGNVARLQGRLHEAREAYRRTLAYTCSIQDKHSITFSLDAIAQVTAQLGEPARAVRLFAASAKLRREISARSPGLESLYESELPIARAQLGEECFARAWASGSELSLDQAVELAMQT